jgi:hypothetical protein
MTPTTYRVLCGYAGPALSRPHPWPVPANRPFPLQIGSAVYVIEDGDGRCCYVGSVNRRAGGLAQRLAEHLDDPAKRSVWHHVWVVPLISPIAEVEVRRIEGVIGAHLGPYLSRRLPSPLPSSRRSVCAVSQP